MSKATIGLADILSAILPALSLDQMLPPPPTQFDAHHHHHQHHHHHPAAIGMVDFCFIMLTMMIMMMANMMIWQLL